ncbi:predicted protein, partial [Phaeodactylum tricornutum CCAP 1055/1]
GACGLSNLGNTCYANSAIQCMSYLPLLRAYLLSSQYKTAGDLNRDNPLGTGGKLLEEFAELLRSMWSAKLGEKSPVRFRSQLGKVNDQFSGADQQDAQEFLNYMLDVLHEDSNKPGEGLYMQSFCVWFRGMLTLRCLSCRFLRRNRSIMADVAMGQVLNTVTCPQCNFSSRNFDPFNLLSIPIPTAQVAGDGMDLGVCLTEFCKTQNLSLSDNWKCPRCKKFRQGQQNMNLWRLPDLLTFHLKRFNMSARWREKLTTKINFPLTGLDLRHWCHKESPAVQVDPMESSVYDLIGVVNHYGSMTGGHYAVSESAEPLWLQFDDELVEPLAPEHVVSEMAYVLFYRR